MERIWYIKVYGSREGPYSALDLKRDRRITPDTLVWRKGFDRWQQIRYVPELQCVFEDEPQPDKEENHLEFGQPPEDDEIALDIRGSKDPNRWLWFLLIAILLLYFWLSLTS